MNFHRLEEQSLVPCPCYTNCIIKDKISSFTLAIIARVMWRPDTIVQFVTYVLNYFEKNRFLTFNAYYNTNFIIGFRFMCEL